jgi:ABC-type Zn uptake system ZnuABC Zn-binding protein ZnuA
MKGESDMRQRRTRLLITLVLMLLFGLLGSGTNRESSGPRGGRIKVVATFSVQGGLVRNVAGDRADVTIYDSISTGP